MAQFFLEMEKDDLPPVTENTTDQGGGLQVNLHINMDFFTFFTSEDRIWPVKVQV